MQTMHRPTGLLSTPCSVELVGIPATQLVDIWPSIRDWLIPAIDRTGGRHDERTVFNAISNRDMQLWLISIGNETKAAMLTEIVVYPTTIKMVRVFALGGEDAKSWQEEATEQLKEWASYMGAERLEMYGRPGWARVLKDWMKLKEIGMESHVGR